MKIVFGKKHNFTEKTFKTNKLGWPGINAGGGGFEKNSKNYQSRGVIIWYTREQEIIPPPNNSAIVFLYYNLT